MPLQSAHVFASHIGHTGKTTLSFQTSCAYAKAHPDQKVLLMDLAEEGDLTKRLLGGVDSARDKAEQLFGGVFKLLQAAESGRSGLTSWLWSSEFKIEEHAEPMHQHNPELPSNIYLISSGAWPRSESPMADVARRNLCQRITQTLEQSSDTWKLFCDTDGDRRPSPFTMLGYGLCSHAIVPLHLNKGDLDRTETMLGVMHELRKSGEIQTQVQLIVWNFVQMTSNAPCEYKGLKLLFTPTKVNMDILDSVNARLFKNAQELTGLFAYSATSEADFIKNSTCVLKHFPDTVLKPSEECGLPIAMMVDKLTDEKGKTRKTLTFTSGDVKYTTQDETIGGVLSGIEDLEKRLEALSLGSSAGGGGYAGS